MSKLVNQRDAAERLNITSRQVRNLVELGMPTTSKSGKVWYSFPECLRWYLDYKIRAAVSALEPEDADEAKRRLTTAQARKAELEVEQLEGRMVTIEDATREVNEMLDGLRSNLLAFPAKHAHRLVGCKTLGEVTAKLEPAVRDLMHVMADEDAA